MIDAKDQKIKVLEDAVINKIAAGEVVERPASIVKELVENAIDAGATRIKIDLEEGGKKSLVIQDNGHGFAKDDMPLSIVRHATSKIGNMKDLFNVKSMGFRGEALASISSVSRFSLVSRRQGEKQGYKLSFDSETNQFDLTKWSTPEGTTISVSDLFYNVPVRLKFLKSAQTEYSQCLETLQALSLANPSQTFILRHNGKEKFLASSDATSKRKEGSPFLGEELLRSRVAYLYGNDVAKKLLYVTSDSDYLTMEALISPPGLDRATSKAMYSFVNGRWVKDRVLRYGILRGYHSHILKGRFPYAFCYLTLSPELVDVNVHPSKTELRFEYADEVGGQMGRTIRDALRKEEWASSSAHPSSREETRVETKVFSEPKTLSFSEPSKSFNSSQEFIKGSSRSLSFSSSPMKAERSFSSPSVSRATVRREPLSMSQRLEEKPELVTSTKSWINWESLKYRGVAFKCYLMFEYESKLLFVDQHAFHERILYEVLCQDDKLLQTAEKLLIPETLSFEPSLVSSLVENKNKLQELSFRFEKISDEEIEVTEVPSLIQNRNLQNVFAELAVKEKNNFTREELHHQLLATIACHSAVRSGDELSEDRVQQLLEQTKGVDFSANCPHGRRVFKWFSGDEVKSWFDRT